MTSHRNPGDLVVVETYRAWFEATVVNYIGNGMYNVRSLDTNRVYLINASSIRSAV